MKKTAVFILTAIILVSVLPLYVFAEDDVAEYNSSQLEFEGFDYPQYVTDEKEKTYADSEGAEKATVKIENNEGIAHLYIIFDKIYGEFTLAEEKSGKAFTVGHGFLHEYIDISELFGKDIRSLILTFDSDAYISEIYAFTEGNLPDWVQIWEKPLEKADILLLSSHSDDEQLFFAGILPYYAGERKVDVQVVYLISHFDTHDRPHEQLNGLWAVGVRNYPIISDFPDLYSESLSGAVSSFENKGYTYEDFTEYIVSNIRRFKPQVLITHDIDGEYGHGTHIYCTDVVMNSIEKTADSSFCPESADTYGVWDVPKTYLHLYDENQITMNWDVPLESFNGKTAFEMTVEGFSHHKSQHWTWFNDWIHGKSGSPVTKATDIKTYSPCLYGLYRSTVGPDAVGGDFLENIVPYKEQTPPETDPPETQQKTEETTKKQETDKITDDGNGDTDENYQKPELLFIIILATVLVIIVAYLVIVYLKKKK